MRRTDIGVGAVILAGLAIIVGGTLWLKGSRFGRSETTISARFREVGQLKKGGKVKLHGVSIGQVQDIELEPDGQGVITTLRIQSDVALPQDAVVLLSPESMFGDWQAEIYPRDQFPGYDYAEPRAPGQLPGYALPDMTRLTAVADQIAENLATLSNRIETAFTEQTAVQLRDAIENIQQLSSQLTNLVAGQQRTLTGVADNLNTTAITMNQAAEAVRRVAQQVETAVAGGEVTDIVANVHSASVQLDSISRVLVGLTGNISTTMSLADTTLRNLNEVASLAAHGDGTVSRMLRDTALYNQLVNSNTQLQALLEDFRKNPRKYINLKIF
jgi:phospholipid/cholesterol/gamma-HCH transport system substrate-binding protein